MQNTKDYINFIDDSDICSSLSKIMTVFFSLIKVFRLKGPSGGGMLLTYRGSDRKHEI